MKHITVILLLSIINLGEVPYTKIEENVGLSLDEGNSCPENKEVSTYYVTALLSHYFQDSDQKLNFGIDIPSTSRDKIEAIFYEADTPQKLREFWRKKGLTILTDSKVCKSLTEALTSDETLMINYEEYRSEYFKFGSNRYLVIFLPRQTRLSTRIFPPSLVLDDHFRVIRKLDLK